MSFPRPKAFYIWRPLKADGTNMGFGKDKKGVMIKITDMITLLTLGSRINVKQDNPLAMSDSFRSLKIEGRAHIEGATLVDGDGPVGLYLVSTDLSNAEIAEAINADGPVSRQDTVTEDTVMRPVFYLGQIQFAPSNAGRGDKLMEFSKKIRWTWGDGGTGGSFGISAFNLGTGALTMGAVCIVDATLFGIWVGA